MSNTMLAESISENKTKQDYSKARLTRWRLQRVAQELLPDERVAFCKRRLQAPMVEVLYSPEKQAAHYGGLMSCGSVWHCPICATRVSERRRVELQQAIASCKEKGGVVYLATYTVAHSQQDNLAKLLHAFLAARKRSRQGRTAQEIKRRFGVLGTVSVREVTWSKQNGWHPHCHELIFFAHEIDAAAYATLVRERWYNSAEREGLSMNEHGFQLDRTEEAVAAYITKFGHEMQYEAWDTAAEITKSHMKQGHDSEHLTPFAILARIAQGDDALKPIFVEYAQWFKGKHQLVWSAGLRALLLGQEEEITDEEIVQEAECHETVVLGYISHEQWSAILCADARGQLLEIARTGNWQAVEDFVHSIRLSW